LLRRSIHPQEARQSKTGRRSRGTERRRGAF